MRAHLVCALWAGSSHEAVGQELAGSLAVQLLALLLHQLLCILQHIVDALQTTSSRDCWNCRVSALIVHWIVH